MAEDKTTNNTAEAAKDTTGNGAEDKGTEFAAITSQADLDKIIGKRLERERKKFEGFEDYKKAAEQLKTIEDSKKTDLQKLQDRLDAIEAENKSYKAKEQVSAWAKEVSDETGVPAELLRGSTLEEMEAHAEVLKKYTAKGGAPIVKSDGKKPKGGSATTAELFGDFLESNGLL